jgi:hypothetical protein
MTVTLRRVLLWITVVGAAYVGCWALFAPRFWYDQFPGFGLHWLPPLGPFNEHLVRDVGAEYLGLGAVGLVAALRPTDELLVRTAAVGWFVFSLPHLLFHLGHLGGYGPLDSILNIVTLGFYALMPLVVVLPLRRPVETGAR